MSALLSARIRPAPATLPGEAYDDTWRPGQGAGLLRWADWAAERLLFQVSATFTSEAGDWDIGMPCPRLAAVHEFLHHRFADEERRMQEIGYPERAVHTAAHRDILIRLAALDRPLRHGHYDPTRLLDMLESWTVGHIEKHDKSFARFVAWHEATPEERALFGDGASEARFRTGH